MEPIIPCVDVAFKKIFGVEENKDLLISLINSIVGPGDQVADVTLLNPYNPKHFRSDKLSILDIKAEGMDGKRFNIEIQLIDEWDYDKRALYYWAKLCTEQLKTTQDYGILKKAIGIHILNFVSIPNAKKYHNMFCIKENDDGFPYFTDLELHTIELKKFAGAGAEKLDDLVLKIKDTLDIWVSFLTRHHLLDKDNLPGILNYGPLQKALNVLDVMNFGAKEREEYESHLKWIRSKTGAIKKHENKMLEAGRVMGIEQGREEGEHNKALAIAKNLMGKLSDAAICSITGLNPSNIQKIK